MTDRPPYFIVVSWLWLAGLLLFMVMVTWHMGLLPEVLASDQTRISVVLLILTVLVSLHCGYRSYHLSRLEQELSAFQTGRNPLSISPEQQEESKLAGRKENTSLFSTYLPLMIRSEANNLALNGELLAEHFHYQHAFGWFAAGAMIKLGLLGTVIGFIMMLTSIGGLDSLEIEQVQQLMQRMTQGMMVALNTTLLGLVGSMILGVQYLFLDHCADRLLVRTLTWVQQAGQPAPQPQAG
ncbi:MAG: MotA/TolQ/ExbB proton channel family protein [Thiolinea sp.]